MRSHWLSWPFLDDPVDNLKNSLSIVCDFVACESDQSDCEADRTVPGTSPDTARTCTVRGVRYRSICDAMCGLSRSCALPEPSARTGVRQPNAVAILCSHTKRYIP